MTRQLVASLALAARRVHRSPARSPSPIVCRAPATGRFDELRHAPEVCGRGGSISRGHNWRSKWGDNDRTRDVEWDSACDYGPGRLVLEKRDGEIVALRFAVGGRWRPAGRA